MIGLIDYGSGNFSSVLNALLSFTEDIKEIRTADQFEGCSKYILPGVGSFAGAMDKIKELNLIDPLNHYVIDKKLPYLGICVGMQILMEQGFEFGTHNGLGWIEGSCGKLDNERLPHMGWNEVEKIENMALFNNINPGSTFYFVHSYAVQVSSAAVTQAATNYGSDFVCALQKDNIYGVQFHPEKSQTYGLQLLENFSKL